MSSITTMIDLIVFFGGNRFQIPSDCIEWHSTDDEKVIVKVQGMEYVALQSDVLVWVGAFSKDETSLVLSCYSPGEQVVRGTVLDIVFDPILSTFSMHAAVFDSLFMKRQLPTNEDLLMRRITQDPMYDFSFVEHPWMDGVSISDHIGDLPVRQMSLTNDLSEWSPRSLDAKKKQLQCHKKYALSYTVDGQKKHMLTTDIVTVLKDNDGSSLSFSQMFDIYTDAASVFSVYDHNNTLFDVTRDELLQYCQNRMCM